MATQLEEVLKLMHAYEQKVEQIRAEKMKPRAMVAPPVIGWRALTIRDGVLTSPAADGHVWEPGTATAYCMRTLLRDPPHPGTCADSLDGRCPGERCACGFVVFESRDDHLRSDFFRSDKRTVSVQLELTGKVIDGYEPYGPSWQGEHARILQLVVHDAAQLSDAERIARVHDVPLSFDGLPFERPAIDDGPERRARQDTLKLALTLDGLQRRQAELSGRAR